MPGGRTKFNMSLGLKDDGNNDQIQSWCKVAAKP